MLRKNDHRRGEIIFDELSLKMTGNKPCCYGEILVNQMKLGKGIKSVKLHLNAADIPILIVEYLPNSTPKELLELIKDDCP
ncbi:hypothetical protein [Enterococcus sp. AZ103]|uniref:hypothetical protein n=1 Tax=Enterococcus sp. AZ103 TaxID=2774628 RepID=UPI003F26CCFF